MIYVLFVQVTTTQDVPQNVAQQTHAVGCSQAAVMRALCVSIIIEELSMDRKYILTAFGYAILGLALGIYMAASKNHGQHVTHAHIMLIGFLLSFIYGLCHKLWLNNVRMIEIRFRSGKR